MPARPRRQFEQIYHGDWIVPARRDYKLACCDCGRIHRVNFRLVKLGRGMEIQFQMFREGRRRTKALVR